MLAGLDNRVGGWSPQDHWRERVDSPATRWRHAGAGSRVARERSANPWRIGVAVEPRFGAAPLRGGCHNLEAFCVGHLADQLGSLTAPLAICRRVVAFRVNRSPRWAGLDGGSEFTSPGRLFASTTDAPLSSGLASLGLVRRGHVRPPARPLDRLKVRAHDSPGTSLVSASSK